jgi:hypothetical protein
MANEWIDKAYGGGAVATTLNGGINAAVTSITVTSGSNLGLDGSTGPYVITVDRTTLAASEEKMLVTARAGNVLTVQRGYDGTTAVSHLTLASVEHVMDAFSIEQANAMASAASANGSMSYRSAAFGYSQLPIGTSGLPIVSNGSIPQYAALGLTGLSAAVQALLYVAGDIKCSISSTEDTGWFLMNGQTLVNAQANLPALWAKAPAAWKSGSNLILPDWRNRVMVMDDSGASLTLGGLAGPVPSAGTMPKTIASGNLPLHTHTIDHDHGSFTSGGNSVDHFHNLNGATNNDSPTHAHQAPPNAGTTAFVVNGTGDLGGAGIATGGAAYALNSVTGPPNALHNHTINQNTGGASASHTHAIDPPNFTGSSGNGGFANTALDITPSGGVVNFFIKGH